jgi:hypothetical protein
MSVSRMPQILFFVALAALSSVVQAADPESVDPITACHPDLHVKGAATCPDYKAGQNADGFSTCKPNECQIRVYARVNGPEISTSDAPPCCPRCQIREPDGSCSRDCGWCVALSVDLPIGAKMTRYRFAAADSEGEGYCPDNERCAALPWSSFSTADITKLASGAQRVSVQFKNWRQRQVRRGAMAVWFTPPSGHGTAQGKKKAQE